MLGDDLKGLENAHKYALERFSNELLPVMETERAYGAIDIQNDDQKSIGEGLVTIKTLLRFLKIQHLCVDPKGEPFDAELHQAVAVMKTQNQILL